MTLSTDNLRISSLRPISSPALLIESLPMTSNAVDLVQHTRQMTSNIIKGHDDRLLIIVGPCSIHDTDAALEYGKKLAQASQKYRNELGIIMRVYFEKPRTIVGWKGLINDPHLDGSFDINHGLHVARKLLLDLAQMGVPAGTEFLDSIIPQYISDVICWGAIGARTTESQVHRELASGLSMPIGFKNGTDGNVKIAIDAMRSSSHPHQFLSVSKLGVPVSVATEGNDCTHIILRGASNGPNYQEEHVQKACEALAQHELATGIMIDCSHGNSQKNHNNQPKVAQDLCQQIAKGSKDICGAMIESNLVAGNQALVPGCDLNYGQSITDACVDWDTTDSMLETFANAVIQRRQNG